MNDFAAIKKNAIRLLDDAIALYQQERFQSATALAILSVEEAGKYRMLCWGDVDLNKLNRHQPKQMMLASYHQAVVFTDALLETLEKQDWQLRHVDDMTPDELDFLETDKGKELRLSTNSVLIDAMSTAYANNEDNTLAEQVASNKVDKLKQRALYVDLDSTGNITSTPESVGTDDAKKWIGHAKFLLSLGDVK